MPSTCALSFTVQPARLRAAAAAFDSESRRIAAAGARLAGAATPDTGNGAVNALLNDALRAGGAFTRLLADLVVAHAEGLRGCADNYQSTDSHVASGLKAGS